MRNRCRGFSLIELLIVVAIILIIAAIAVPNLLKSRIAANETAAVANMKTTTAALATYNSLYARCGYPDSIGRLGPGNPPSPAAAGLLDPLMANDSFVKQGYTYTYLLLAGVGDCAGEPGSDFELEARPVVWNKTGIRGFWVDSSNMIRGDPDGDADISSPTL